MRYLCKRLPLSQPKPIEYGASSFLRARHSANDDWFNSQDQSDFDPARCRIAPALNRVWFGRRPDCHAQRSL